MLAQWSEIERGHRDFTSYDTRDGAAEAEADLAAGTLKWKLYGLHHDLDPEEAQRWGALGLKRDRFMGCITSPGIRDYAYRYNTRVRAHLAAFYGEAPVRDLLGPPLTDPARDEG